MSGDDLLTCPCGATAPQPLPAVGKAPRICGECGTPLVRGGQLPGSMTERAAGAALLVAPVVAVLWTLAARSSGSGAHWMLPLSALAIAVAARVATRVRGPGIQFGGIVGFVVFLLLGEVLIYRTALLPRLIELHAQEGAHNPEVLARDELRDMSVGSYLHIELSLGLFLGVVGGLFVVAALLRAPAAVTAFEHCPPEDVTGDDDAPVEGDGEDGVPVPHDENGHDTEGDAGWR